MSAKPRISKTSQPSKTIAVRSSAAEYLTFVAASGSSESSVEMRYEDENVWLTQKMMATLYDVDVRTANYHLKKIFADRELSEISVIRNFRITAADGKDYQTQDGQIKIAAQISAETLWLSQQQMAELFQTTQQNISLHLQNAYDEGELERTATHKDFLLVRLEGARAIQRGACP